MMPVDYVLRLLVSVKTLDYETQRRQNPQIPLPQHPNKEPNANDPSRLHRSSPHQIPTQWKSTLQIHSQVPCHLYLEETAYQMEDVDSVPMELLVFVFRIHCLHCNQI